MRSSDVEDVPRQIRREGVAEAEPEREDRFGKRLPHLIFATILGLTALVWIVGFTTVGVASPDSHDYAQIGRAIARGQGFRTLQVFPRHLGYLDSRGLLDSGAPPSLYLYRNRSVPGADAIFSDLPRTSVSVVEPE